MMAPTDRIGPHRTTLRWREGGGVVKGGDREGVQMMVNRRRRE